MITFREFLRERLRSGERISFRDYMEQALYHPDFGYYSCQSRPPGRASDFFTSVSVGKCFGDLLAEYLAHLWRELDRLVPFVVEEQGANNGQLAADVLEALCDRHGEVYACLRYHVVERSARLELDLAEKLKPHASRVETAPAAKAHCLFANELLDAMPVHRLAWRGGQWRELWLKDDQGSLGWEECPIEDARLAKEVAAIDTSEFEDGYLTEIQLDALDWLKVLTTRAPTRLLLVDYGHEDSHAPHRSRGSLQCYRHHQRHEDALAEPGEQDMTVHVNFTRLLEEARFLGWEVGQFTDQHRFLTKLALPMLKDDAAVEPSWLRQFQQLTHPTLMGRAFRVLELKRGPEHSRRSSGAKR